MKRTLLIAALTLLLVFSPHSSYAAGVIQSAGETRRVSVSSSGGQADSLSINPSISADGRYVAFQSNAANLVASDTNETADIFIHDTQTGQIELVSLSSSGTQGNMFSGFPVLSADGRYVAFLSYASNLVDGDTNGTEDFFVHDRLTGQTERVSISSSGQQTAGLTGAGNPGTIAISADGQVVAFSTSSSALVTGDTNGVSDVFVHDRQTHQTTRVSISSSQAQGNDNSYARSTALSGDGRYVTFYSRATNLVDNDTSFASDIFVHDRQSEQTTRLSVTPGGVQGNGDSYDPAISADGRFVAFVSGSSNLAAVAPLGPGVLVHDRATGEITNLSLGWQGSGYAPVISAHGRFVAYYSSSANLVSGDTNGQMDVFLHDRKTAQISRMSISTGLVQGNNASLNPSLSGDGRFVVFQSNADNLVTADTNTSTDIFLHENAEFEQTYSISGVISVTGGKPLPGARVSSNLGYTTLSAADGSYTLTNLPEGNHILSASKRGYTFTTNPTPVTLSGANQGGIHFNAELPGWTLIYYLAADNDLFYSYLPIFNQLEAGAGKPGVSVVALYDPPGAVTRYYWIKPDDNLNLPAVYAPNEETWNQGKLNTSDPDTLANYVNWAMDTFPAAHYAVILDDHGDGLGGAMVDDSSKDIMTLEELQTAFEEVVSAHQKLDVLVMNACLMGLVEDGYQFRNVANYYASSEDYQLTYFAGYTDTLDRITQSSTALEVARLYVDGYADEMFLEGYSFTMSVADLGKVDALKTAIEGLAGLLDEGVSLNAAKVWNIRQFQVRKFPKDDYIDLFDFARLVKQNFSDADIQAAAQSVMDAIDNTYILHNRSDQSNAHGVSIFFPEMRSSYYNGGEYDFALGTDWAKSSLGPGAKGAPLVWGNLLVDILTQVDPGGLDDPTPPDPQSKPPLHAIYLPSVLR